MQLMPCKLIDDSILLDSIDYSAIIRLKEDHHIDYYLGKRILSVLPLIDTQQHYHGEKLNWLKSLKMDLIEKNAIIPNRTSLFANTPLISAYYPSLDKRFEKHSVREFVPSANTKITTLMRCLNEEEQAHAVIETIDGLLRNGTSIDDIVIVNALGNDEWLLQKEALFYGFEILNSQQPSLDSHPDITRFMAKLGHQSMNSLVEEWMADLKNHPEADTRAWDALKGIILRYGLSTLEQHPKLLEFEIEQSRLPKLSFSSVVKISSLSEAYLDPKVIYLTLNVDDLNFPALRRDDDYLTDAEKTELGQWTSLDLNNRIKNDLKQRIHASSSVYLFYAKHFQGKETRPTDLLEREQINQITYQKRIQNQSFSKAYDRLSYAKSLYSYKQYGLKNEESSAFKRIFEAEFGLYDPQLYPLQPKTIEKLNARGFAFSATNLEAMNACRFRFLLDYLLKILPMEETDSMLLGNLAHYILSKTFTSPKSVDELSKDYVNLKNIEPSPRLSLWIDLFCDRLDKIILHLKNMEEGSTFVDAGFEQEYHYDLENPLFKVKGKIDRIKVLNQFGTKSLAVIDYKTGRHSFSFSDFEKGTDIQPLFYLNLLKKTAYKTNTKAFGFYYQLVNQKRLNRTLKNNAFEQSMKLDGVMVEDKALIDAFSPNYNIKKLTIKADGTFKKTNILVSQEQLDTMVQSIDQWIEKAVWMMNNGNYRISPVPGKSEFDDSPSCQYCPHKGVCYMANQFNNEDVLDTDSEEGDDDLGMDE